MNISSPADRSHRRAHTLTNVIFGPLVAIIGVANLVLVHPVPGLIALVLALLYLPWTDAMLQRRFGHSIPLALKIAVGVSVVWFTLGVSDLGDLID